MRSAALIGLVMGGVFLGSQALAFQLNDQNWSYMLSPMGEPWVICPDRMPGEAVQRTKDGASAWHYERFRFTFASEACLSDGNSAILNGVNQIDFGPLQGGTLAQTVFFFFTDAPDQIVECDMRFNSAVNWHTGTGAPAANQFDWWSVAAHEMGHCLGLDHEDSVTPLPLMRTSLPIGSVMRQLTTDDVAGRNAIYGQQQAVSNGDGGGGGCSLMPGSSTAAPLLFAALGNIFLPMVILAVLRIWSRWRGV